MIIGVDDIRYCGDYSNAYSFGGGGYNIDGIKVAIKLKELDAVEYACSELKAITIGMYSPLNIQLFVQRGDNILYTQNVPASAINGGTPLTPTTITLDNPVPLAGEGDLYIGYITPAYASSGFYPYGTDAGPYVEGGAEMFFAGQWFSLADLVGATSNLYIIGHTELEGAVGVYNLYRQRKLNGSFVGEPELIGRDLSTASYTDENIELGGEYCYWATLKSKGVESCPSSEDCVFILYQQSIERTTPIAKTYKDSPFKIDHDATDGNIIRSTAEDIDYFAGRVLPVELDVYDGDVDALTLSGSPSNYTASIETAGSVLLQARQLGIPDTLLAASAEIRVNIAKKDLKVTADDKTRKEGEVNPDFTFSYDSFITGEGVNNLDVPPTATCTAGVLSPIGEYPIIVTVGVDKNYNLIPEDGTLYVIRSDIKVNAFTPDGDGFNDAFMPGYKVKIFNRFGVLIYETTTKTEQERGWNGRFHGNEKLVNPGVYYYVAYDDDGKVIRKGSVNVVKK
jgi:gliding motility-associated-like protein